MRVHLDDVHLTAVTTPLGLYKWLAMPMGLWSSPAIHQCRVTAALWEYIGKICHIYLDNIVIWSNNVIEHMKRIDLIMKALQKARLYCNPKKCHFYLHKLDFLCRHISKRGIEPNSAKIKWIMDWPVPKSATDVHAFLGLVCYISFFPPKLADHTIILTPLTMKEDQKHFPPWTDAHQTAFEAIKSLVMSAECLTTVDHENPGDNKIFITCDASNWWMGAVLSFGPSWETAWLVAFDSMQLKSAKKNYPVHEKELLAIIHALKKWWSNLMGTHIHVYTDHWTLENFDTQKDLSCCQLQWQEFLSQYDMTITYIPGKDNSMAGALSCVALDAFPDENPSTLNVHSAILNPSISANTVLSITKVCHGYIEGRVFPHHTQTHPHCTCAQYTPIPTHKSHGVLRYHTIIIIKFIILLVIHVYSLSKLLLLLSYYPIYKKQGGIPTAAHTHSSKKIKQKKGGCHCCHWLFAVRHHHYFGPTAPPSPATAAAGAGPAAAAIGHLPFVVHTSPVACTGLLVWPHLPWPMFVHTSHRLPLWGLLQPPAICRPPFVVHVNPPVLGLGLCLYSPAPVSYCESASQ